MEKSQNALSEKFFLKKVDQSEIVIQKPTKQPVFFAEKAQEWKIQLEKILKDKSLTAKLASINYSEKVIQEAISSIKQLLESIEAYQVNMERKKNITKTKNQAIDELHKLFMFHKILVQNLFRSQQNIIEQLKADKLNPQRESLWIRNIKQFYTKISEDTNALNSMKPYNVDDSTIKDCLKSIDSIEETILERDNLSTELIDLTAKNAELKGELINWISTFKKIVSRGLVNDQEALLKLGL
ncbi:hypothetical protein [Chondrinema litorale]|uniref:hypothetical protein n=1 Tax=Chondrinema litorale TaxID=2994555 RepID=UPI002542E190|nr:hypothetical protein [Chondrinema litorale]UZR94063.1 hypothetical protein OQ292_19660 [Chondrinema litorale]